MYKVYSKGKTEVISEDTNANIAYNTVFKRTWTMGTIIAATIQSIGMSFMFSLFLNNNNSKILFILYLIKNKNGINQILCFFYTFFL